ncbi:MAG TPA: hypothetical protein VL989_01155 [Candidatus Sulfotelmatobacter sp.]|nr:hypothetical protein [Candidatus Sulfotelmatobacter sp.]
MELIGKRLEDDDIPSTEDGAVLNVVNWQVECRVLLSNEELDDIVLDKVSASLGRTLLKNLGNPHLNCFPLGPMVMRPHEPVFEGDRVRMRAYISSLAHSVEERKFVDFERDPDGHWQVAGEEIPEPLGDGQKLFGFYEYISDL